MAIYERRVGDHVTERVQAEPGSAEEKELGRLAEGGEWTLVEAPKKRRGKKDTGGGDRPAKNASQEEWAAYAITQGADEEEATSASRDDLIQAYGG